jgi:Cof subfamily protein (haloacid dehalogenase superfamily)
MKQDIRLIALDLDGTLFNSKGIITKHTKEMIQKAGQAGITVIISTGRPYIGLPLEDAVELGIKYAITANGAGIYQIPSRKCLFEDSIAPEAGATLLTELYQHNLHLDAFIGGNAYTQSSTRDFINRLTLSDSMRTYIRDSRTVVDDLASYIVAHQLSIQKLTLNFTPDENGNYTVRDNIITLLTQYPELHYVSGGFNNLEITKKGTTKGEGLRFLCNYLNIPIDQSMACGDSENDFAIVTASGLGVAMANAEQLLLDHADFVTLSNDEDGIAYAIEELVKF